MSQSSRIYQSALELFQEHLFEMSLELVEFGLEEDPAHGGLWELKGLIHCIRKEIDPCCESLLKAAARMTLQPVARCVLADCFAVQGDAIAARKLYLQVFDDPQSPVDMMREVTEGLVLVNEWGLAAMVCQRWCEESPEQAEPWYKRAYSLAMIQGDPDEIVQLSQEAVRRAPDRVDYRTGLAILLHAVGRSLDGYDLISGLSKSDLALVRCVCGLRHLQEIYDQVGDGERSNWCQKLWER